MNTITKQQLENCDLTHKHGGNGFIMCEDIDKEYCRITSTAKNFCTQAFLAAKSMLVVGVPIKENYMDEIKDLRQKLKDGNLVCKGSWIHKP